MAGKSIYPKHGDAASRLLEPYQDFLATQAFSGLLLLGFTLLALVWANSPWAHSYHALWETEVSFGFGAFTLSKTLHHWINDGLMAIFFFTVGLEIKRELLTGELASMRKAMLPIVAAVGGMVVPAAIYASLNFGTEGISGWGVPMATDIAFAIGILALVGRGVPLALKVFLTALAIVDDLGAVLVIALFYTSELNFAALGAGAVIFLLMLAANRLGFRAPLWYLILGAGLWLAFLLSGVHATIAGVLAAMAIPEKGLIGEKEFEERAENLLARFRAAPTPAGKRHAVQALEYSCLHIESPLQRLEHAHHPWVAYVIMPVFALSNAGVELDGDFFDYFSSSITLGVILALVLGKQIGVTLFAWLAVKTGAASLPEGVSWMHIYGAAWLAGIGFTMSLFIANLGFADEGSLTAAKAGILAASALAGTVGYLLLKRVCGTARG